jgi:hypothetical protein
MFSGSIAFHVYLPIKTVSCCDKPTAHTGAAATYFTSGNMSLDSTECRDGVCGDRTYRLHAFSTSEPTPLDLVSETQLHLLHRFTKQVFSSCSDLILSRYIYFLIVTVIFGQGRDEFKATLNNYSYAIVISLYGMIT